MMIYVILSQPIEIAAFCHLPVMRIIVHHVVTNITKNIFNKLKFKKKLTQRYRRQSKPHQGNNHL